MTFPASNSCLMSHILRLPMLVLVVGLIACSGQDASNTATPNTKQISTADYTQASASEMLPALKSGELSVTEYMDILLEQAAKYDATFRTFITLDENSVREAAAAADAKRKRGEQLGPLFGIPISLKDLIVTKDLTTTFGTKLFADFIPTQNAAVVDKLTAAGAIIFGKNNAQEIAYGSNGFNSHYGQQLNPYDPTRIAGGSSGGSAAAVAARILPIAIGSDTAASIRVPAAYTGLYGLRPTTGRYDNSGVFPIAPALDTIGPMTRSVADLALIDAVLSDEFSALTEIKPEQLRLGVPRTYFHAGISQEMRASFSDLLAALEKSGVELIYEDLPNATALVESGLYPILFYETYPAIENFLENWGDGTDISQLYQALGWDIKALWDEYVLPEAPKKIPEAVYRAALEKIQPEMQATYDEYFQTHQVDAIIFPATATEAPAAKPDNPMEMLVDGETVSIFLNDHNSSPGALAGQPGIVLPLKLSKSGLPLGVSLDGKRGQDRALLAIARAIDQLRTALPAPNLNP